MSEDQEPNKEFPHFCIFAYQPDHWPQYSGYIQLTKQLQKLEFICYLETSKYTDHLVRDQL